MARVPFVRGGGWGGRSIGADTTRGVPPPLGLFGKGGFTGLVVIAGGFGRTVTGFVVPVGLDEPVGPNVSGFEDPRG